jgi:hypothetical protein
MPLDSVRNQLNSSTAIRFDETWDNYDPIDLMAIQAGAHQVFMEDQLQDLVGTSVFFARQLDFVKARTYERLYPEMLAAVLVPDATDVPEWAETISVTTYDAVGMAKIIANYADDLPRADVRGVEIRVPVKTLGDSYGYNVNELRASRATGVGLDARKAEAARRAMELKLNTIRIKGDPDYGLYGLFTHPNLPELIFPHAGAWSALNGTQIIENLNMMMGQFKIQNYGMHTANFLGLAPDAFLAMSTKTFLANGLTTPITALSFFRTLYPGVEVMNVFECRGAGADGHDVALLYERSIDNISHEYVMPFTQLPPEARNLEFVVNCIARSGGVHIWYPLAFLLGLTT